MPLPVSTYNRIMHRALQQLRHKSQFNYHPRCDKLGITHIYFVDDMLMFSKADEVSIKLLFNVFQHFYEVSGLYAKTEKSSMYIAGVGVDFKNQMLEKLKLTEGVLLFKYLGIISQCLPIVEKMIAKVLVLVS